MTSSYNVRSATPDDAAPVGPCGGCGYGCKVPVLPYMPLEVEVKQGLRITISRLCSCDTVAVQAAVDLLRYGIEQDNAWPFETALDTEGFNQYFLSHAAFQCTLEAPPCAEPMPLNDPSTDAPSSAASSTARNVVGAFYIKPNFPGRCDHICNGGFIVAPQYRRLGMGEAMGRCFLRAARDVGFKAAMFNLVFGNNSASAALWEKLGFKRIGTIPMAARMPRNDESRGEESGVLNAEQHSIDVVDAHQYYHPLRKLRISVDSETSKTLSERHS